MTGATAAGRVAPTGSSTLQVLTPPTVEQRLDFAAATCRGDRFWLLKGDGSNDAVPRNVSAHVAVTDGRPYFGWTHPWIWAIDVDDPAHPSFVFLLATLSDYGLDFIEVDSGGTDRPGRHVYVHAEEEGQDGSAGIRERVRQCMVEAYPELTPHEIDFRPGAGGCPIRPPMSPHRLGGWALPIDDWDGALQRLLSWAPTSPEHSPVSPNVLRPRKLLPAWVDAWEHNDTELAARLGRPMPPFSEKGRPDANRVDLSLALAYLNCGRSLNEFLAVRLPHGSAPSPRSLERPRLAERYLCGQWNRACERPAPIASVRDGLELLPEFRRVVEAAPLNRKQKLFLGVLAREAERLGRTTLNLSTRDIVTLTGMGFDTIVALTHDSALAPWVQRTDPNPAGQARLLAYRFRLRIHETLSNQEHPCQGVEVSDLRAPVLTMPERDHPMFIGRGDTLAAADYEVLLCFVEPATIAEALKRRGDVSRNTVVARVAPLAERGLLVERADARWVVAYGVDWDRLAIEAGIIEATDLKRYQHVRQRSARDARLQRGRSPKMRAESAGIDWTDDEQSAWVADLADHTELMAATRAAKQLPTLLWLFPSRFVETADGSFVDTRTGELVDMTGRPVHVEDERPAQPPTDDGRTIDPSTGEIMHTPNDALMATVEPKSSRDVPHRQTPATRVCDARGGPIAALSLLRDERPNCVCCGLPTSDIDTDTGLPWHESCLMPQALAKAYRQTAPRPAGYGRWGLPKLDIDPARCRPAEPVLDRYGDDWANVTDLDARQLVAA